MNPGSAAGRHHPPPSPVLAGHAPAEPSRRLFWLLFGLILAGSLALRLYHVGTPQLWEDDYLNLDRALMDPARLIAIQQYQGPADTIFDFQPPLSYLLVHAALAVSKTTMAARLPSILAGMLSILAIGLLGARTGGPKAGLAAAAMTGLSLFHLDFSRAIKPYALFLCTLSFSLYFLVRCLEAKLARRTAWLTGYAAATAAMLATAYQGVPVVLAEGLCILGLYVAKKGVFSAADRNWRLGQIVLAADAAVLVWLPLAPGLLFVREFLENPRVDPWQGLGGTFFANILNGLYYQHAVVPLVSTLLLIALALLGLLVGRRAPVLLLAAVGLFPALAVLSSQSDLRPIVSWRHLVCLFPGLAVFAGSGAAFTADMVAGFMAKKLRLGTALLVTAALCAVTMGPGLTRIRDDASRTLSNDRDLFRYLSRLPVTWSGLTFTGYQRNTKTFSARWHLPGRFSSPGDFSGPGYGRTLVVDSYTAPSQRLRAMPRGTLLASWGAGIFKTRVSLAGLPRRAPLLLAPDADGSAAYGDDFRDWRYYRDAFASRNFTVDTEVGLLRPTRYEKPAMAVWRFDLPPGSAGAVVRASVVAALYKRHADKSADSLLSIAASGDGKTFTPLAVLSHADFLLPDGTPRTQKRRFFEELGFYHECREAVARLDLTPFAAGGTVYVRVSYAPGVREGFLNVAGLAVTAEFPAGARPEVNPLAFYAANLARNCAAPAYTPDSHLLGQTAYVFAAPQHPELAARLPGGEVIGAPADLAAFTAAHPDLEPAYVLRDASGTPAVIVHDPALNPDGDAPRFSGADSRAVLEVAGKKPFDVGTAWLWGRIDAPTIAIGATSLRIPVSAPDGTVLRLTPGGKGLLAFSPNFDPPDFIDAPNAHFRNMAASTSYPEYDGGVTCRPGTSCSFDYIIVSGLPMTELRLMTYPRLYGDPDSAGSCRASVSTDGKHFRPLIDFRRSKKSTWSPMFTRHFARLRFDKPATFVTVRFSLFANANAEFWSPTRPIDRMVVEADLDARSLPPVRLRPGAVPLRLTGAPDNNLHLTFDPHRPGLERVWPGD
ncbi:MAG: glycosyltransferase family 39 protein [Desulfovibrio sp.]